MPLFTQSNAFLKDLMKGKKITEVAQKLGIQQSYLSQIISGHRRIPKKKFDALLALLDIPSVEREKRIKEYEEFLILYKGARKGMLPRYQALYNRKLVRKYQTVYFRNQEGHFEIHIKNPQDAQFYFLVIFFDPDLEDPSFPDEAKFYRVNKQGGKEEISDQEFGKLFPEFKDLTRDPYGFFSSFKSSFGEYLGLNIKKGQAEFIRGKREITLHLEDTM